MQPGRANWSDRCRPKYRRRRAPPYRRTAIRGSIPIEWSQGRRASCRAHTGRARRASPSAHTPPRRSTSRCRAPCASWRSWRRARAPRSRTSWQRCRCRTRPFHGNLPLRLLSPALLALPAALPAHAGVAVTEIEFLDVGIVAQLVDRAFKDDAAVFQNIAEMRHRQRHVGVLLDQENGNALLLVEPADDREDFLHQQRREA